jgi:hypothetical protein
MTAAPTRASDGAYPRLSSGSGALRGIRQSTHRLRRRCRGDGFRGHLVAAVNGTERPTGCFPPAMIAAQPKAFRRPNDRVVMTEDETPQ